VGRKRLNQQPLKIRVNVFVNDVSAERLWEIRRPLPSVKIATNLNLISINKLRDDLLEVPFVFAISYTPAVAQINFKGKAHVVGEKEELKKIYTAHKEKKAPPLKLI